MTDAQEQFFPHLVIGLGNPGPRYRDNRHNLGFKVVEALARKWDWTFCEGEQHYLATAAGRAGGGCVLLKPLTYMNLSGEAVAAWLKNNGLEPDLGRILVVCDDLALPLGVLRMRGHGSSGGQNGLLSVIEHLDSDRFSRLRLGIDGSNGEILPEQWPDYVLADFEPDEQGAADDLIARAVLAVECWLEKGPEQAASRFNGKPEPPAKD